MSKVSDKILRRVYLLFGGIILFTCLIVYQVIKIQFIEKDRWLEMAQKERVYYKKAQAVRGSILSDNGTLLATSQPFFKLSIDPSVLKEENFEDFDGELDELCKLLEKHFGERGDSAQDFKSAIQTKMGTDDKHMYLVRKTLDYREFKMTSQWPILKESPYKGGLIGEKIRNKRFYPFKNLAGITLGLMKNDTIPLKGLEYSFNKDLKGENGQVLVQKIAGGVEIPVNQYGENGAIDGCDIRTTLNIEMQDIAETALLRGLEKNKAAFGVAIIMEVETGAIKAVSNLKRSSDSTRYYEGYNYAFAELLEPGSTIKLVSYLAALEDGAVKMDDSIDTGKGYHMFYGQTMKDDHFHGKITYGKGFEVSSNVVAARMIDEHFKDDPGKFFAYLDKMGLNKPVNSQLIGEPTPRIVRPGDEKWSLTTLPWTAIGYNTEFTPIQILTLYNAVANDGVMMEPRLVNEVKQGTFVKKSYGPKVLKKRICRKETAKVMQYHLEGVVQRGTARNLKNASIKLAGKTGTAKKVKNGKYVKQYRASFCGYFPADKPKYSCFVMIDEPSNDDIYGATVAGPVFLEIAEKLSGMDQDMCRDISWLARGERVKKPVNKLINGEHARRVYKQLAINTASEPQAEWVRTQESGNAVDYDEVEINKQKVPDVSGMSARDALNLLENLGLKVTLNGYGKVRNQSLPKGTALAGNKKIVLELN